VVSPERYETVRDDIVGLLHACRDPLRNESPIDQVYYSGKAPFAIGPTEADLYVIWRGSPLGLVHPQLGRIGPIPYRRPGGHTGAWGFAYLAGQGFEPCDGGTASAFDMVPTIIDLLDERPAPSVSGRSLLPVLEAVHGSSRKACA
jgi:hypothetical protein